VKKSGSNKLLEVNNASEHWDRCDAHGCAWKKHGFHQRSLLWEKLGVMEEYPGQPYAEEERSYHACDRNCD